MPDRAALIITDAEEIDWETYNDGYVYGGYTSTEPTEQLLADLRLVLRYVEKRAPDDELCDAAQRVRDLLPKETT